MTAMITTIRRCRPGTTASVLSVAAIFVMLIGNPNATAAVCPITGQRPGDYSQLSVELCFQDWGGNQRHLRIPSPDGSLLILVDGDTGQMQEHGRRVGEPFSVSRDEEWIWSPDSQAVIVTTILGSSGPSGAGITFLRGESRASEDLTKKIQTEFAARHPSLPCSNEPNVAGLGWLGNDTKSAVLVAEIPTVHCENASGYFEAFVVSLPDAKIVRVFSMRETISRFRKLLGQVLLEDIKLQKEER